MFVWLFAGDNDICLAGMDAYAGQFESLTEAMDYAEEAAYDWAHVSELGNADLCIINTGKYNSRQRRMIWAKDERHSAMKRTETEYRQLLNILQLTLQSGIVVVQGIKYPDAKLNGESRLVVEMLAYKETIQERIVNADALTLQAMAIATRSLINRAFHVASNPSIDDRHNEFRKRWVGTVKKIMKETEWLPAMPKDIK